MRLHRPRRRGAVLVLFALLAFGLMGLAAVVLDLGLARVSQKQMQTAADVAALEGLRSRDERDEPQRRALAQSLADLSFEGTGTPRIDLAGGVTDLNALQTLTGAALYNPAATLQPNVDDEPHGDMVAGTYGETVNPGYDASLPRDENGTYQRRDFVAVPRGDAFLVRLRRTNDFQKLDNVSGVSSSGPTVPLLFGRASTIQAANSSAGYSPRHHGLSVRATAIADARPVLSAGPPIAELSLPGVAPFALNRTSWNTWRTSNPDATTITLTFTPAGLISAPVTGYFTTPATDTVLIGQPVTAAGVATLSPRDRYVPLFDTVGGMDRIVGFLHAQGATTSGESLTFTISTGIAAQNASAVVTRALPAGLTPEQVNELFAINATILTPLRSPALVNRHLGPP